LCYNSVIFTARRGVVRYNATTVLSVQRKFTKRIPGISGLSYHSRLKALNLESLKLRRLRADLLLAYKILFGLLRVNSDIFSLQETSHNYAVMHICYTNSDVLALIDAIFSAFELLVCGTACPPKPRTSPD